MHGLPPPPLCVGTIVASENLPPLFLKSLLYATQFSAHCCSLSCWRLCLENSGRACLWSCFIRMTLFWLRKQRNCYWRRWGIGKRGWKRRVWEWILERQKSCGVGWPRVRLRIQENIHVVFAGRELATTQSFVWSVIGGFTRDVVAFQESWRVMLITIVGGAWRVRMVFFSQFCWKRLWLHEPNVKLECVPKFYHLGDTLGAGGGVVEGTRTRGRCAWQSSRSYLLFWRPGVFHTA